MFNCLIIILISSLFLCIIMLCNRPTAVIIVVFSFLYYNSSRRCDFFSPFSFLLPFLSVSYRRVFSLLQPRRVFLAITVTSYNFGSYNHLVYFFFLSVLLSSAIVATEL